MILVVTGLRREARIAESPFAITVSGGGDQDGLRRRIDAALLAPVRGIVSFGIAGALSPALRPGDCVLATAIVDGKQTFPCDEAWRNRVAQEFAGTKTGAITGTDSILATAAEKSAWFQKTGAIAADMESHVAARAADTRGLPFLAIRTISDASTRALPSAALSAMKPGGGLDALAVARSILADPAQIPGLIRTGRESEKAFSALLRCRRVIGVSFAFPDLG